MGNKSSAELLHVPFQHQKTPFRATENSYVTEALTCLCAHVPGFRSTITVTDEADDRLVYTIKSSAFSSKRTFPAPNGTPLFTIKCGTFSSTYKVYRGEDTSDELFAIKALHRVFARLLIVATFTDRETGAPCRVVMDGDATSKVVLLYFERGSPTLSQLNSREDFIENIRRYQVIGRIRSANGVHMDEDYFIEAARGVDLTLLVLMWRVRYTIDVDSRTAASG